MLKNPTPRQIALFCSIITASIVMVTTLVLLLWLEIAGSFWYALSFGVLVLTVSYFVIIYYLRKYIYRKIKLIYKTIYKHKLSPKEKKDAVNMNTDIIGQMEEEVSQWAKYNQEELNKYKTWAEYRRRFVGDISHELKTPIFNIQGYIHTLLDGGMDDENINVAFLQKAAQNVTRLHTIVEDLEAIAKIEAGQMMLEMQHFDIRALAEEVFDELDFKAKEKEVRLEFKDGAGQSYKVRADRDTIRQVLVNLMDNSIKYGKKGGRTKVSFYEMGANILVEVADNGIGIPKEHLNHVFDRFYRVDKHRSRRQGGSGLGLSIVKHIIEAHKQVIHVRSSIDLGSTFSFTLEKANFKKDN